MFQLLKQRNFVPFFGCMGLGALNDNMFKSALAILIAYNIQKETADLLVQASAGLFILPFFLFSGISGQICDKFEKSKLIVMIKSLEILIMSMAAVGFYINNIYFLMFVLFLMGTQSTLFGPIKYSILPQHLKTKDLLTGNALVSMGTFIAILIGTICGGILVSKDIITAYSLTPISIAVVIAAIIGMIFSKFIPSAVPSAPNLKINLNLITETWKTLKLANTKKSILLAIMGISWFWFFGFFFLASLPSYCRDVLRGDEQVATILLTFISIGMGIGSILCEKLSSGNIKIGLVFLGGLGLSLFSTDLYLSGNTFPPNLTAGTYLTLSQFLDIGTNLRVSFDLLMIGLSGGMFIVPLYTLIQQDAPRHLGSRIIASNNIVNAIFMVSAAIFAMVLFSFGLNILQIFLIVSMMNLAVTGLLLYFFPQHIYHFFFTIMVKVIYNFKIQGKNNLPTSGPVLIVSNHVSYIDPFLICSGMNRPPRYVMDKSFYDMKILKWFFTSSKSIPITPKKICPQGTQQAIDDVIQGLTNGDMIVIFPEGFITKTGEMIPFKNGVERILDKVDATVVPVAIKGMWGSWFSRIKGKALKGLPPNRLRAKVELNIGAPVPGDEVNMQKLQEKVEEMRGIER
jgi:1-acyl-sn-glycerol-3-phosphate acyltransferase